MLVIALFHLLPLDVLGILGVLSDHVSDMSPAIVRPIEHVVFTLFLN